MKTTIATTDDKVFEDRIENLIAIGAAIAANCIPCFEHLYEKAINSGMTHAEIQRVSDIAGDCGDRRCPSHPAHVSHRFRFHGQSQKR